MDTRNEINGSLQWKEASKGGIILGLISFFYILLSSLLAKWAGNGNASLMLSFLSIALWCLKFYGCIALMKLFLIKLKASYRGVDSRVAFSYGAKIAFLSAFVYSVCYLANILYLSNDVFQAQLEMVDTIVSQNSSMFDSNSLAAFDKVKESMPTMMTIYNLIYCTLYGVVLSLILSKNLIPDDDFEEEGENNLQ